MQVSDLDAVVAIEKVSFAAPWSRNMFLEEIANRAARLMVFKSEDTLVGYICFWEVLDEAHLMNVAVHPDYRGHGYGKFIMDQLEAMCLRDDLKRIILEVGRRNLPARRLYRKCGFSAIGFRKKYYSELQDDALVMEKWLGVHPNEEHDPNRTDAQ
ncbi:MAG: ribosomal protein S18-alanine N-acetyltransferase [Desulfomonile tiedjei]|nr:ribosomal protein S18-alanine N-acetyltransferase [Desulfomonile tiedjei]